MKMTHHDIFDIKKLYVERLGKLLPWPVAERWQLVHKLWPKIEELESETEGGSEKYRVQMSELANIISAIMCGDHNVEFHTSDTGVLQTLPIVGMCSAVTSHSHPGYALIKIEPEITFNETVPVGVGVTMSMKLVKGKLGKRMLAFELRGRVDGRETELFPTPRIITMFKISTPPKPS